MAIFECVPNVSIAEDREAVSSIANEISSVSGVKLLHVDIGQDVQRTVFTFIGDEQAIFQGAVACYRRALAVTDMTLYRGEHPAIGAIDVCPFVPLAEEATMDQCVSLAHRLGAYVGKEFCLPVYCYREAALKANRVNLAQIRRGGLQGLVDKLKNKEEQPDFGPNIYNPRFGATVIGARPILLAFNICLATNQVEIGKQIARTIRSGGSQGFEYCRAIGWLLRSWNIVQVSTNLENYQVTGLHVVMERVLELARAAGVEVLGSEIIGLVPQEALLASGRFYQQQLEAAGLPAFTERDSEDEGLIEIAVSRLNLSYVSEFNTRERLIESYL